jgi:hypothetical protein
MNLVTIQGRTYNLDLMVRYEARVGTREVGVEEGVAEEGRPIFGEYRYLELVFADGSKVELDGVQSEALLRRLGAQGPPLDLDAVDEAALGHVVVRDTEIGDVVLGEGTPTDAGAGGGGPVAPDVLTAADDDEDTGPLIVR